MVTLNRSFSSGDCNYNTLGPWKNVTRGYLDLKFSIQGKIHYGWARLNVTVENFGIYAMLTGYAYETVVNKPIVTGRTKVRHGRPEAQAQGNHTALEVPTRGAPTLALLARGSAVLDGALGPKKEIPALALALGFPHNQGEPGVARPTEAIPEKNGVFDAENLMALRAFAQAVIGAIHFVP